MLDADLLTLVCRRFVRGRQKRGRTEWSHQTQCKVTHSHSRLSILCFLLDNRARRPNTVIIQDRLHLLRSVLAENKELVIGPAFTLLPQLFSLPYFIASLILRCQNLQGTGFRYLLTASYFTTFIPPLMSFRLYISPSSFYTKEWRATSMGKWLMAFKQRELATSLTTRPTVIGLRTR